MFALRSLIHTPRPPTQIRHITKNTYIHNNEQWYKKTTKKAGITKHSQNELGEIVYVDFNIKPNDNLSEDDVVCSIESTKAVGEMNMPFNGTIKEINTNVQKSPKLLNEDPEGNGWLIQLK